MARPLNPICRRCGATKERIGSQTKCRACKNASTQRWKEKYPERCRASKEKHAQKYRERMKASQKNSHLYRRYRITLEEYDRRLKEQGGVCAICRHPETRKHPSGSLWSMSVDHCHSTGRVRGLLCGKCNAGIASFLENTDTMAEAISYLKANKNEILS